jgi:signal transduction histidine kinase/DNA-binding NarL/FixJ family response regulator
LTVFPEPEALLLIEQSPGSLDLVRTVLPESRQVVLSFEQGEAVTDLVSRERIGLVFCDQTDNDPRGLLLLRQVHRAHPQLPILLVVAAGDHAAAMEAFRHGAADVLSRPLLAADVARAIERVRELRESQAVVARQQRRAARSLEDLVLLRTIGITTSSEENLQRLLDRVVEAIQVALKVEIVSLMLGNDSGQLEIQAAKGVPAEVAAQVRIAPGEGVAGCVLASGEPVLIDDLATDGRFPLRSAGSRYRSGSLLSVPIRTMERVIGVLNVNNKHDGTSFAAADQELLTMIAHQTALAIENLKLVGRLREQSQELEQAHADLLRLHLDRTRFVCSLSHELKTPLTSILGFSDLLVNFFERFANQEIREYIGRIHTESLHLDRLITGMLRLFAIDSESENWRWEAVPLRPCLEEVLNRHSLAAAELDLNVEVALADDLEPLWADRDKLVLLLDALIDNAVKFNRAAGGIHLRAENREANGRPYVYLAIANDGRTVQPEQADLIFQQYSQLGDLDTDKPGGVGIGLATCRAILRKLQGWIFLEPVNREGTCLGMLIPARPSREEACHAKPTCH